MRRILFICALSIAALWGCKRMDVGPEPPPCLPATAEFKVYGSLYWPPASKQNRYYSDTVYQFDWVNFEGPDGQTTYEWKVGNDPRTFTQKNFRLDFRNTPGVYVVKLKTSKQPTTDPCTGLAIDTVTFAEYQRTITITTDTNYRSGIKGCYVGYFGNDSLNSFDLCIKDTMFEFGICSYGTYVFSKKLNIRYIPGGYLGRNLWIESMASSNCYIFDLNTLYEFTASYEPLTNIMIGEVKIYNDLSNFDISRPNKILTLNARKLP